MPVGTRFAVAGLKPAEILAGEVAVCLPPLPGIGGIGVHFGRFWATAFTWIDVGDALWEGFRTDPALQGWQAAWHPKSVAVFAPRPVHIAAILAHQVEHA